MKTMTVLREFHDKDDFGKVYKKGDTLTFDDARAEELSALGLVVEVVKSPDNASLALPSMEGSKS